MNFFPVDSTIAKHEEEGQAASPLTALTQRLEQRILAEASSSATKPDPEGPGAETSPTTLSRLVERADRVLQV